MAAEIGLKSQIWNNNLRSLFLLAGFPVLLVLLAYAGILLFLGLVDGGGAASLPDALREATSILPRVVPFALGAAAIWFLIAWFFHQSIIDAAVGARPISRKDHPDLYNLLENLCISRGMAMPALRIIDTDARNAFASGLREKHYSVTVTRGLVEALNEAELEAVLAHELSHIRHKDVRLMVIAVIFVGIISFVGELLARGMFRGSLIRSGGNRRGNGGNAIFLILVALAIVALAFLLAMLIRFSLSRRREFMADAGSVELTRNPDAMISALVKVSAAPVVERAPAEVREMFLYDHQTGFAGLFATHPSMDKRIAALVAMGGRLPESEGSIPAV